MYFESIIAVCRAQIEDDRRSQKYFHVAVLLSGKKITNLKKNDYSRTCINGKLVTAMHAEHNCCKNYKKIKGKMLVLRFCRQGKLQDSKPCSLCRDMLLEKGLKYIYCSTENGSIIKINLNNLEPYVSNAQLKFTKNNREKRVHKLL